MRYHTRNLGPSLKRKTLSPFPRNFVNPDATSGAPGEHPKAFLSQIVPASPPHPGLRGSKLKSTRTAPQGRGWARTWPRAGKPRPGSSLLGSLGPLAQLPLAASASRPRRTSFREPQRCLAEARLGAVRLARRQAQVPPRKTMGLPWERNAADGAWSVGACSRSNAADFRPRKIPGCWGQPALPPHPGLSGLRGSDSHSLRLVSETSLSFS